jgi:hypothetical protein
VGKREEGNGLNIATLNRLLLNQVSIKALAKNTIQATYRKNWKK